MRSATQSPPSAALLVSEKTPDTDDAGRTRKSSFKPGKPTYGSARSGPQILFSPGAVPAGSLSSIRPVPPRTESASSLFRHGTRARSEEKRRTMGGSALRAHPFHITCAAPSTRYARVLVGLRGPRAGCPGGEKQRARGVAPRARRMQNRRRDYSSFLSGSDSAGTNRYIRTE